MQFNLSVFRWTFEKQFSLHWKGFPQSNLQHCSISKSSFPPWQVEVFHLLPSNLHHVVSHVIMYLHHIANLQESCREQRMSQDSVLGRKELQCCPVLQYWPFPGTDLPSADMGTRGQREADGSLNPEHGQQWLGTAQSVLSQIHPHTNLSSPGTGTYPCICCIGQPCLPRQHWAFCGSQESHCSTKSANLFIFSKWRSSTTKGVFNTQC